MGRRPDPALHSDLSGSAQTLQGLNAALQTQTTLREAEAEKAAAAGYKAEILQLTIAAMQKRIDDLEAALYLARSDQQRSAALADDLRARATALGDPQR